MAARCRFLAPTSAHSLQRLMSAGASTWRLFFLGLLSAHRRHFLSQPPGCSRPPKLRHPTRDRATRDVECMRSKPGRAAAAIHRQRWAGIQGQARCKERTQGRVGWRMLQQGKRSTGCWFQSLCSHRCDWALRSWKAHQPHHPRLSRPCPPPPEATFRVKCPFWFLSHARGCPKTSQEAASHPALPSFYPTTVGGKRDRHPK